MIATPPQAEDIEDYEMIEMSDDVVLTSSSSATDLQGPPRRNSSTGFYFHPLQSYEDYTTAYLNALLLFGIFQTPMDLKPSLIDYHPMQTILRNAYKNGFTLKIVDNMKSSLCFSGILLCKSKHIWYAIDVTNKRRVDSMTGMTTWEPMGDVTMIYKFEKVKLK
jgi:hypothetical protein